MCCPRWLLDKWLTSMRPRIQESVLRILPREKNTMQGSTFFLASLRFLADWKQIPQSLWKAGDALVCHIQITPFSMEECNISDAWMWKNNLAHRLRCYLFPLTGVALLASKIDDMIAGIWVIVSLALKDVNSLVLSQMSSMIIGLQRGRNVRWTNI